jgi:hypothetical protein
MRCSSPGAARALTICWSTLETFLTAQNCQPETTGSQGPNPADAV